jgi:c-di-GMP-binding flagellar brake protein YcgR
MEERRMQPRYQAQSPLFVWDKLHNTLLGQVTDISEQGLELQSKNRVRPETVFRCQMSMPENDDGIDFVSFEAESRWCNVGGESGTFNVGLEFVSITPGCQAALINLILAWKSRKQNRVHS